MENPLCSRDISSAMALKRAACVILCFFAFGSARVCRYRGECHYGETCCSDKVCRKNCYDCSFDSECAAGEECCDDGACLSVCPSSPSSSNDSWAAIVGGILGAVVLFVIIISIVACFCCACCPYYHQRSPGTVMSQPATRQTFVSTHISTISGQPVQHHPPPAHHNHPLAPGYDEATSPYNPSYPQQPAHYPPPPIQGGQPSMPPPYY